MRPLASTLPSLGDSSAGGFFQFGPTARPRCASFVEHGGLKRRVLCSSLVSFRRILLDVNTIPRRCAVDRDCDPRRIRRNRAASVVTDGSTTPASFRELIDLESAAKILTPADESARCNPRRLAMRNCGETAHTLGGNPTYSGVMKCNITDRMLLAEEVADALRIHRETVRNYLRRGIVRGVKIGRCWRVPTSEVERLKNGGAEVSEIK